jgi:hypothetical protein
MILMLNDEDSLAYLEGGWPQYDVEERIIEDLIRQDVTDVVAVVLADNSAVAFYVDSAGKIL